MPPPSNQNQTIKPKPKTNDQTKPIHQKQTIKPKPQANPFRTIKPIQNDQTIKLKTKANPSEQPSKLPMINPTNPPTDQ